MSRAIHAAIAIIALTGALWPAASSARTLTKRSVAEARFGLINAKAPRIGPKLVLRGGFTPLASMVRPRFIGGMVDIYPSSSFGFRFAVGTRYFMKRNYWIDAEQFTRGLLYDPHMTRGGRGLIRNFRRYTPAMTVGYDVSPADGLVLGIEGGAISGRAIPALRVPRSGSFQNADGRRDGLNEVVTLSARLAF